jgi:hypothetical protein
MEVLVVAALLKMGQLRLAQAVQETHLLFRQAKETTEVQEFMALPYLVAEVAVAHPQ